MRGREQILCLTDAGRKFAASTAGRVDAVEDEILASWSEQDRADFIRLNEQYLSALREKERIFPPQEKMH